jgi:hypothetical protein
MAWPAAHGRLTHPLVVPCLQYNQTEWSLWDSFDVKGPMTLQQFIDKFKVCMWH